MVRKYVMKDTLKFGGKNYRFYQAVRSKATAKKWTKNQRDRGYNARFVKRKGSDESIWYLIYRRKR